MSVQDGSGEGVPTSVCVGNANGMSTDGAELARNVQGPDFGPKCQQNGAQGRSRWLTPMGIGIQYGIRGSVVCGVNKRGDKQTRTVTIINQPRGRPFLGFIRFY